MAPCARYTISNPSINKMYNDEVAWVYFNFGDAHYVPGTVHTYSGRIVRCCTVPGTLFTPSVKPALLPANAIYAILCLPAFKGS